MGTRLMLSTPAAMVMSHTARLDEVGGEMDRLLRRATLTTIDGGCRHLDREPRGEHRLAGNVYRLLAGLHDAPEDDVLDHRRVDARATGHLAQHVAARMTG